MSWCFAIINNRLGEIYFDNDKKGRANIYGHCYVREEEMKTKTKEELRAIKSDTAKGRIVYRNKKYKLIKIQKNV